MGYASPADLNAYAAVAEVYDEIGWHTADPGSDPDAYLVAAVALTMGTAGAAGPGALPATDGRTYSGSASVVLDEPAEWVSLRVAGVVRRTFKRNRGPLGPGTFPVVYGLAVSNQS
jgi:hypothetical protein